MPPSIAKRPGITIEQRRALRKHSQAYPILRQTQLVSWFEQQYRRRINQSTVSDTLGAKYASLDIDYNNTTRSTIQRDRAANWPVLERALVAWLRSVEVKAPISDEVLREKATRLWRSLPDYHLMEVPQFSHGWLYKFKRRHNIQSRVRHGEAGSVDEALVSEQMVGSPQGVPFYHL